MIESIAKALAPYAGPAGPADKGGTFEELLARAAAFGQPRVSMINPGKWYASVDLNTDRKGLKGSVASEINHTCPRRALLELLERLEALK